MDNKTRDGVIDYINKMILQIENDIHEYHWLCHGLRNRDKSYPMSTWKPDYVMYLKENRPSPKQHLDIYNHISFLKSQDITWWRYWPDNAAAEYVNEQKILFLKILLKNI